MSHGETDIATNIAMADGETHVEAAPQAVRYSIGYQRMAITLLALVYIFNFVDRQVMNILAQSIKTDLQLSDTQLGLITGLAFAIFYSVLGLPIARYAERGDRPGLIAVAITVWSGFTIACGFAHSFLHLALCRLGVGVGEAGSVPPSHSLITEFTPRERRAKALALFAVGLPLGSFFGLGFGGVVGDMYGWRAAFIIAGIPGLLIAIAVRLVIREPRRAIPKAQRPRPTDNIWVTLGSFIRIPTFRWTVAGGSFQSVAFYGTSAFLAPYFLRAHPEVNDMAASFGLKATGFLGIVMGLSVGLAGALGAYLGGYFSDKYSGKSLKSYVATPGIAAFLFVPTIWFVFLTPSVVAAMIVLAIACALNNVFLGPMHATTQGCVGPQQRATMSAFVLVIVNLIGLSVGPPLAGILSDYFRVSAGMPDAQALRTALIIVGSGSVLSGLAFFRARRTIDQDTIS